MDNDVSILVAEDDSDDVFLLRRLFRSHGFERALHVVTDGQEAVEYLSGNNGFANREQHPLPDIVVSDLKMPRLSGFELIEWLRSQPQFRHVPIIAFSSSDFDQDRDKALKLGANLFLSKGSMLHDSEQLIVAIKKFCGGGSRQ